MIQKPKQQICLTVDVEEYFHASNLSEVCKIKNWSSLPSRVEKSTNELLQIFGDTSSKGTFFILGHTAKRFPNLIKEIQKCGHEIASHGYSHKIAYLQSRKQFFRDISRSKKLLEDLTGIECRGYRAPNFSITNKNLWAYDLLLESGYTYDSSLNPIHHPRYGNSQRSNSPELFSSQKKDLLILPVATLDLKLLNIKLPIAGGAYWRLLPWQYYKFALKFKYAFGSAASNTPICYIHPWEIDTQQPYFASLGMGKKLRHYTGVKTFKNKINEALINFQSVRIDFAYLRGVTRTDAIPEFTIPNSEAAA